METPNKIVSSVRPPIETTHYRSITYSLIHTLQNVYENHRVPETYGMPPVSGTFFDIARTEGMVAAGRYLFNEEQIVGAPSLSAVQKIAAIGIAVAAVVGADKMIGHQNARARQPETRDFKGNILAAALYAGGAALLMAASEEGSGSQGSGSYEEYESSEERIGRNLGLIPDTTEYYEVPAELEEHEKGDDEIRWLEEHEGMDIDTIYERFPELFKRDDDREPL